MDNSTDSIPDQSRHFKFCFLYLELMAPFFRWEKSSHVEHLRKHTKEYVGAVHGFLEDVYFSKLPAAGAADEAVEAAEGAGEEETATENAKRVAVAK